MRVTAIYRHSELFIRPLFPEFQFVPLPKTNPVLIGHRWKEYHEALGLKSIVDFSWQTVLKEKPGMIHLLDFPYNGETPRPELVRSKITDNEWHLCVSVVYSRGCFQTHQRAVCGTMAGYRTSMKMHSSWRLEGL